MFKYIENPLVKKALYQSLVIVMILIAITIGISSRAFHMASNALEESSRSGTYAIVNIGNVDPNLLIPDPQLTDTQVLSLILDNYELKFSFHGFLVGTKRGQNKSFTTSCGEIKNLYLHDYPSNYHSALDNGIWIAVEDCGYESEVLAEELGREFYALIYMPLEALDDVSTMSDLTYAIRKYGILYQIDQQMLAAIFEISESVFPPNQTLPEAP